MPACAPCLGVILLVVGVILIGGGIGARFGIPEAAKRKLREELSVDSAEHKNYKAKYQSPLKAEKDGEGVFVSYTLFNLTNPTEFLAGRKPEFKAVGPFTYVRRSYYRNVRFLEDGKKVTFDLQEEQVFRPDKSNVKKDDEKNIIQANMFYMAAVSKAGGENNLQVGIAAGTFKKLQSVFGVPAEPNGLKTLAKFLGTNSGWFTAAQYAAIAQDFSQPQRLGTFLVLMGRLGAGDTQAVASLAASFPSWGIAAAEWPSKGGALAQYYRETIDKVMGGLKQSHGFSQTLALQKVSPRVAIFDPNGFLKAIQPTSTASLFSNHTATDTWYRRTAFTGKGELADMNGDRYTEVDNITRSEKYAKKIDLNVRLTTTDAYQDKMADVAYFYYPMVERALPTKKGKEDDKVRDIPTTVYVADREALTKANADYNNTIPTLINIAPVKNNAPLFLTPPYNDEVASRWTDNISGVAVPKGYDTNSVLKIEPKTGLGISVNFRVQLNYMVSTDELGDLRGRHGPLLYPLVILNQHAQVSETAAKDLRRATVEADMLAKGLGFALVGLGAVLVVLALLILVCFCCCGCCGGDDGKK